MLCHPRITYLGFTVIHGDDGPNTINPAANPRTHPELNVDGLASSLQNQ